MCLSVCHTLFTLFNFFFAPTSRSPLSNLFRYSEFSGKSNLRSGLGFELFAQKLCTFASATFFKGFFLLNLFTLLNGLFAPTSQVQCPNFLDIRNPWGKSNEEKLSQIRAFLLKNVIKSSVFLRILSFFHSV